MKTLSFEQMEEINGGSGCGFSVAMAGLSFVGMALSAATVAGAVVGVASFYGSIISVGLSCAD